MSRCPMKVLTIIVFLGMLQLAQLALAEAYNCPAGQTNALEPGQTIQTSGQPRCDKATVQNVPQRRSVARLANGSLIDSLVERNRRAREFTRLRHRPWLIIELLER